MRRTTKRNLLAMAVSLVLLPLALTGCDFLDSLFGSGHPDLTIESIEPLMGTGGLLTGVRIVFANNGTEDVSSVKYAVIISADTTISAATDYTVYEASISIIAGGQNPVDLSGETQIQPWMESHGVTDLPSGTYYLGAIIDPNNTIVEGNETNNSLASNISFEMGGPGDDGDQGVSVSFVLSGASDLNDRFLYFGVFPEGATEFHTYLAAGNGKIAAGTVTVEAMTESGDTWYGEIGTHYDVYLMVDMNYNEIYDKYVDNSYLDVPYDLLVVQGMGPIALSRSDFGGRGDPQPAVFGVYSDSHEVYVEPRWSESNPTYDRESTLVSPYDGPWDLKVAFTTGITWFQFGYDTDPTPVMDIRASTNLVFYLDASAAPGFAMLSVLLGSPDAGLMGVNAGPDVGYLVSRGNGVGGNWDKYVIPVADLAAAPDPAVDPSQLNMLKFGAPKNASWVSIGCTLYFDDIHFE